ncbi:hypothetical protein ABH309_15165 [Chromobacterium piscinae]|uniref:Uncharacterized protein n=1 Tax=Chromobacterium piscinae TaxID=686831 RepID=A0ABV0H929_9NEIS
MFAPQRLLQQGREPAGKFRVGQALYVADTGMLRYCLPKGAVRSAHAGFSLGVRRAAIGAANGGSMAAGFLRRELFFGVDGSEGNGRGMECRWYFCGGRNQTAAIRPNMSFLLLVFAPVRPRFTASRCLKSKS